jgi:hypothetical protein
MIHLFDIHAFLTPTLLGDPLNSTYDDLLKKRGNNKRERERER